MLLMLLSVALVSSAITCLALVVYYRRVVQPALERRIAEAIEAIGAEVGRQVRTGVVDGVNDLASSDQVRRTTEKVASTGASMLGEGLSVLLGARPRRRDDP